MLLYKVHVYKVPHTVWGTKRGPAPFSWHLSNFHIRSEEMVGKSRDSREISLISGCKNHYNRLGYCIYNNINIWQYILSTQPSKESLTSSFMTKWPFFTGPSSDALDIIFLIWNGLVLYYTVCFQYKLNAFLFCVLISRMVMEVCLILKFSVV